MNGQASMSPSSPHGPRVNGQSGSLASRIRRVELPGEYMYPSVVPEHLGSHANGTSSISAITGTKGKGKGRAGFEGGLSHSAEDQHSLGDAGLKGKHIPAKREEVVRLLLQALRDAGYNQSAEVLEAESGYVQEPALASSFRQAILGARWSEAIQLLIELGVVSPDDHVPVRRSSMRRKSGEPSVKPELDRSNGMDVPKPGSSVESSTSLSRLSGSYEASISLLDVDMEGTRLGSAVQTNGNETRKHDAPGRRAIFMIVRQKYLELIEAGQTVRALKVLRLEVTPLASDTAKLHALSGLMMCMKKNDLYAKAQWDGAEGSSRQVLLDDLQEFLPTGVIMPPQRLATLFDQARRFQENRCLYHSGNQAVSLLSDHRCQREVFPTVATHVLAEHTNEVWTIEWSSNGQYLASAGKDKTIHIWKIEPPPTRSCEKYATLTGHTDAVSALAWSPDGKRLVSAAESTIILWDTTMGAQLAYLPETHQDMVSQIQWISDEEGFVTAGMDQKIIKWSRDGKMKKRITTGSMRIFDFVLSKDGSKMIATANVAKAGASGSNVRPTASRLPVPGVTTFQPDSLDDISPNYSIGKMERNLVIYDMITGDIVAQSALGGDMGSISLSDDGKQALVSVAPDTLQLWNVEDNALKLIRRYSGHLHTEYQIKSCFGGRDKGFVVSASEDSHIYVWQRDTGKLLESMHGHTGVVNTVAWNPVFHDIFASCADDDTIRLWQPASVAASLATKSRMELPAHAGGSEAPQISPLGIPSGIDMDLVF